MYSILVDRVIGFHRSMEQAALFAQVLGRRLVEEPPTLERRLAMLADTIGMSRRRTPANLSDDEVALRRALGLRGY